MVDGVGASSPAARSRRAREAAVLAVMHDVAVGRGDDSEGLQGGGGRRDRRPARRVGTHVRGNPNRVRRKFAQYGRRRIGSESGQKVHSNETEVGKREKEGRLEDVERYPRS